MEKLKEILFDLFNKFDNYEDIINSLRNLNSENVINDNEYNTILNNYDKLLKEYIKGAV